MYFKICLCLLTVDSFTDLAISSKSNPNGAACERELQAWEGEADMPEGETLESSYTVRFSCSVRYTMHICCKSMSYCVLAL